MSEILKIDVQSADFLGKLFRFFQFQRLCNGLAIILDRRFVCLDDLLGIRCGRVVRLGLRGLEHGALRAVTRRERYRRARRLVRCVARRVGFRDTEPWVRDYMIQTRKARRR